MNLMEPSYLRLWETGELAKRVAQAKRLLSPCVACPRACKAERAAGEMGACGVAQLSLVASYGPHFGEEPVLVGKHGSGPVFFAGCNLHCVYCQNYDISQMRHGQETSPGALAEIFLEVQRMGCHNLNLVTPSHCVPQILEGLLLAIPRGFRLPLVYNTSGYDSVAVLRLLDGVVDIYMPDIKYADDAIAEKYSGVKAYTRVCRVAIREMYRQVGDLVINDSGIACRGLIVRHLVLPNGLAGSRDCLRWLAEYISRDTYLNVMAQYYPAYRANEYAALSRNLATGEYADVVRFALSLGFHRGIPFDHLYARSFLS